MAIVLRARIFATISMAVASKCFVRFGGEYIPFPFNFRFRKDATEKDTMNLFLRVKFPENFSVDVFVIHI